MMRHEYSDQEVIDESLKRIELRRGSPFTTEQRAHVHEVARTELGMSVLSGVSATDPEEHDKRVEGLIRMSLVATGETLPVPDAITLQVLNQTPDAELSDMLYDYICTMLNRAGHDRVAVVGLPRGLRVVYLLYSLDGEVYNGGFHQFFTNSSGMFVPETLDDCLLVKAEKRAEMLKKAVAAWEPARKLFAAAEGNKEDERSAWRTFETEIEAKLNELDREYYALEKVEPLLPLVTRYLRDHLDECVTNPSGPR